MKMSFRAKRGILLCVGQTAEKIQCEIRRFARNDSTSETGEIDMCPTFHDAAYVALAEALEAPLLTCNRALAKAPGHRAIIELVEP